MKYLLSLASLLLLFFLSSSLVSASDINFSDSSVYNTRLYGSTNTRIGWVNAGDINGDGKQDLVVGAVAANESSSVTNSGSVWIIFDFNSKIPGTTGGSFDLTNPANYNVRLDGPSPDDTFGDVFLGDMNKDGKDDLVVSAGGTDYNNRIDSGSVYIIYSSLLESYASLSGQVINLSQPTSFNIRLDGPTDSSYLILPYNFRKPVDIDNDDWPDLLIHTDSGLNGKNFSGSVYAIFGSLLQTITGTGKTLDLSQPTSYNLRFDGDLPNAYIGVFNANLVDLNSNGKKDLVIGEPYGLHNTKQGSVFVIYDSIFGSKTGTGNNFDLSTASNYSIRIDGFDNSEWLGYNGPTATDTDIDGDGKNELIIGAMQADFNGRTGSGSVYIINNSILSALSGTGNIFSTSDSTKYSLRLDGDEAKAQTSWTEISVADIDNDGKKDLAFQAEGIFNQNANNKAFILYNNLLNISSTGLTKDLANSQNYSVKYTGNSGDSVVSSTFSDLDRDGSLDYLLLGDLATVLGRTQAGVIYTILNFPHTISINSSTKSTSALTVKGQVNASKSTTSIAGVQIQLDNNNPTGNWQNCSADDGAFNSKSENYTCTIANPPSTLTTVYTRSFDQNNVNTPRTKYASVNPASKLGDIDNNGKVDIFDYNLLLTNFGKTGSGIQGDLDNNGKIDIFDYNTLLTNFGK